MISRGSYMKALSKFITRIGHLIKSRKACKGNCVSCSYFEDCCGDYFNKVESRVKCPNCRSTDIDYQIINDMQSGKLRSSIR